MSYVLSIIHALFNRVGYIGWPSAIWVETHTPLNPRPNFYKASLLYNNLAKIVIAFPIPSSFSDCMMYFLTRLNLHGAHRHLIVFVAVGFPTSLLINDCQIFNNFDSSFLFFIILFGLYLP